MDATASIFLNKHDVIKLYDEGPRLIYHLQTTKVDKHSGSQFYSVMRPFIFCLRLFGSFPYTVDNGILRFKLFSWWSLYSAILIILQIVWLYISAGKVILSNNNYFDSKFYDRTNMYFIASQGVGPIFFWIKIPHIIKFFGKWHNYEKDLHSHNIVLDMKLNKWVYIYLLLLYVPFVFSVSYYQSLLHGGPTHMPAITVILTNSFLAASLCLFTGIFAITTASPLIKYIKKCSKGEELTACRKLWCTLAELTTELGNSFGPFLTELLLLVCVATIVNCYSLIYLLHGVPESLIIPASEEIRGRFLVCVVTSVMGFVFCEFGHRCSTAVGSNVQRELLELSFISKNQEFKQEVNLFMQTVHFHYPHLELCSFITLNRKLWVSLLSGGITYLIVLVQFRISQSGQ